MDRYILTTMSLENMSAGEQTPDIVERGNSLAQTGYAAEQEDAINSRRTVEVMASEYENTQNKIAQLDEQINRAVDAGLKNEGGMGDVHKNIGRQLTIEKENERSKLHALEKEMMGMKNATLQ